MWKVSETLRVWIQSKENWAQTGSWLNSGSGAALHRFDAIHEPKYKEIKANPAKAQTSVRTRQKNRRCSSNQRTTWPAAAEELKKIGISTELVDEWAAPLDHARRSMGNSSARGS